MMSDNHDRFREIHDLCAQLLYFIEAAHRSESDGEGSILLYSHISDCAQKIRTSAEERRRSLAYSQWTRTVGEDEGTFLAAMSRVHC